jgi:hypothetical protein
LGIFGSIGCRTLISRREELNPLLAKQLVEVVDKVGGAVAVVGNEDMYAPKPLDDACCIKRLGSADHLFKMDGRA